MRSCSHQKALQLQRISLTRSKTHFTSKMLSSMRQVSNNFRWVQSSLIIVIKLVCTIQARLRWKMWVHLYGFLKTSLRLHSRRCNHRVKPTIRFCFNHTGMKVSATKVETMLSAWRSTSACSRPQNSNGTSVSLSNTVYLSSNNWSCLISSRLSSMIRWGTLLRWPNRATPMTKKWTLVSHKDQPMISTIPSLRPKLWAVNRLKVSRNTTVWSV